MKVLKFTKFKSQPRIKGVTRTPLTTGVIDEIEEEITRLRRLYGVSRSWIIATVLADAFKIKSMPRYYEQKVQPVRRRA